MVIHDFFGDTPIASGPSILRWFLFKKTNNKDQLSLSEHISQFHWIRWSVSGLKLAIFNGETLRSSGTPSWSLKSWTTPARRWQRCGTHSMPHAKWEDMADTATIGSISEFLVWHKVMDMYKYDTLCNILCTYTKCTVYMATSYRNKVYARHM